MVARLTARQRGYDTRWDKFRAAFLIRNPLCVMHLEQGITAEATVVDHIQPHKGDMEIFWRPGNHQALCKPCHDKVKQGIETRGFDTAIGLDGWPIDPNHPANKLETV